MTEILKSVIKEHARMFSFPPRIYLPRTLNFQKGITSLPLVEREMFSMKLDLEQLTSFMIIVSH